MTNLATTGLQHFQDRFARALLNDDPADARVAALAAQPGFAVYRNTVMKGCIDALQANYPAVARLVGDEWFRAAAAVYVRGHLPCSPMLLDYGADFAEFLAGFEPAAELPYLPHVARLERFWSEAHCARDEPPLAPSAIAALSPDQMSQVGVRPHASARWTWFDEQPVFTIWFRNRYEPLSDSAPEIDWNGEGALIVRPYGAVDALALDQAGCAFLDACAGGQTLAAAAQAALAIDAGADLAHLMARLLEAGALAQITETQITESEESQ
jgi:hypothetical protein